MDTAMGRSVSLPPGRRPGGSWKPPECRLSGHSQPAPGGLSGWRRSLPAMAGPRLLLVDDEDNLRSMLEAALRHNGFDVHPAASGRDAIDAVGTVRPDMIVLDVMLPDLDGFAVCRKLRADGDHVPVVFLTARSNE